MAAVTVCTDFGAQGKKKKSVIASTFSPSICHEVMGLDAMILAFWMLSFKSAFHSHLSPTSRGCLVPLHFLPLEWYHLHVWGCYFSQQSWFQLVSSLWFIHPHILHDVLCISKLSTGWDSTEMLIKHRVIVERKLSLYSLWDNKASISLLCWCLSYLLFMTS